ncbi:unnamed protein product [Brassica napus]|uniref:(rape) hypothetical protein n=1 Tax=Brassica napus TaxID=3708 RepID=A0A816J3B2_BRANA|nr:unnamed protein product [Brassica napus]
MASPPTCIVFHLKRMIETHHNRRLSRSSRRLVRWFSSSSTYDDSISSHGVSSSGGRCLQFGDQLLLCFSSYSKHMLLRQLKQLDSNEESSLSSSVDMEKNINDLKGKDLLKRLHEVGTLAQISSIQGDQVILVGHRRTASHNGDGNEEPLTVKVNHLKDKPFDMDDDVIKATSFEAISTLRDVHKRLRLTLELMKKKGQISKIQETIAKAIEEKISSEQRRYLLNEELKAIKKELGVETNDKSALSGEFTYPRLADFGAAICGANRHQAQEVHEELDETIANAIEEKISGEQRRYLLIEQHKAIKKVHKRLRLTLELMKKKKGKLARFRKL